MNIKFLKYIAALFIFPAIVSCQKEEIEPGGMEGGTEHVTLAINLTTDLATTHTRAVDMTPNAIVHISKLWVGVYDVNTGEKLNDDDIVDLGYRQTATGSEMLDVLEVNFDNIRGNSVCVVGVANYDDVYALDEMGTKVPLEAQLIGAVDWNRFKQIYVDTESAYSGLQGTTTPLLMGYYIDKNDSPLAMVDQFAADPMRVTLDHPDAQGDIFFNPSSVNLSNRFLRLRKMVSQINVNIEQGPDVEVYNLQYKRMNMPKTVYLAERVTDAENQMKDNFIYSPNKADEAPDTYYESDSEWTIADAQYNFSFQQFENKHWARPGASVTNYTERVKRSSDGTFNALAETADEPNNYASYFILAMKVVDKNKGIVADVEYIVPEGYTSDIEGKALYNGTTITNNNIFKDFSCFRNTDYTYTIQVNGIDNIETQVSNSNMHFDDQKGSMWEVEFPAGVNHTTLAPAAEGTYNGFVKFTSDSLTPDEDGNYGICFRVSGYDDHGDAFDIFFNLPDEVFTQYTPVWPAISAHTSFYTLVDDFDNIEIPDHVLKGFLIDGKDIKEFVKSNPGPGEYSVSMTSNAGALGARYLYIANKKDLLKGIYDADGCTVIHTIYGLGQRN